VVEQGQEAQRPRSIALSSWGISVTVRAWPPGREERSEQQEGDAGRAGSARQLCEARAAGCGHSMWHGAGERGSASPEQRAPAPGELLPLTATSNSRIKVVLFLFVL